MPLTRAGATALVAVLGVVALLGLMTWAAAIGPDPWQRSSGEPARSGAASSTRASPAGGAGRPRSARPDRRGPTEAPDWLRALAGLLEGLVAVGALVLLWRQVRRLYARWSARERSPRRAADEVDLGVLDPGSALAAAIEADAESQRAGLGHGEARNAIVTCWHRFETAAESTGVRRQAWQTPSEFVLDVLERAGADPSAVISLADLYREARFSDHPITDVHRGAAAEALAAIHRSLGVATSPAGVS